MIELVLDRSCSRTKSVEQFVLEELLKKLKKVYINVLDEGRFAITAPYLIVDGVPLDYQHSLKYLQEECEK